MTNQLGRVVGVTIVGLGLLALVISAPAGDQAAPDAAREAPMAAASSPDSLAASWAPAARRAAAAMFAKYGQPDEIADDELVWRNTGPFARTVVYKDALAHDFPAPHADVLEQFVRCRVPLGRYDELARFDGSVHADRTAGLLSARGDSEADNLAALNLAHEIAEGRRSAASARAALARLERLEASGKSSPYARALLFKPGGPEQADPD